MCVTSFRERMVAGMVEVEMEEGEVEEVTDHSGAHQFTKELTDQVFLLWYCLLCWPCSMPRSCPRSTS